MITIPESGLFGPGDYGPDFVTIDELRIPLPTLHGEPSIGFFSAMLGPRVTARDTLLDLAHDLDARGLVVVQEHVTRYFKYIDGNWEPFPAYTADADAVTGPKPQARFKMKGYPSIYDEGPVADLSGPEDADAVTGGE